MSPPPVTMLPPPLLPTFRLALVSGCAACQTKLGQTQRAIERHMPHKTCISCDAGSLQTCCSSSSTSSAKAEGGGDLAKRSQGNQSTIDPDVRSLNDAGVRTRERIKKHTAAARTTTNTTRAARVKVDGMRRVWLLGRGYSMMVARPRPETSESGSGSCRALDGVAEAALLLLAATAGCCC
jgi:hypothetical protein